VAPWHHFEAHCRCFARRANLNRYTCLAVGARENAKFKKFFLACFAVKNNADQVIRRPTRTTNMVIAQTMKVIIESKSMIWKF